LEEGMLHWVLIADHQVARIISPGFIFRFAALCALSVSPHFKNIFTNLVAKLTFHAKMIRI